MPYHVSPRSQSPPRQSAQKEDAELQNLKTDSKYGEFPIFGSNSHLFCETSERGAGIWTTNRLVTSKYFWPSMNKDISSWAGQCISCQNCKIKKDLKKQMGVFSRSKRFHTIHLDIIDPFRASHGFKYCLAIIDGFTRWPEATPLTNIILHNHVLRPSVALVYQP